MGYWRNEKEGFASDDIWRYVGKLTDAQRSMLDDRFKWKVILGDESQVILALDSHISTFTSEPKSHVIIVKDVDGGDSKAIVGIKTKYTSFNLYLSPDVILDPLLSFRKELKGINLELDLSHVVVCSSLSFLFAQFTKKRDVKVSVNDIVIKAVANALRNVPEANAKTFFELFNHCSISVSIGMLLSFVTFFFAHLPSPLAVFQILMVENVNAAYWVTAKGEVVLVDSVDVSVTVATEKVNELATKARSGKLTSNEFQGGTFSITNLGMFPVDNFCAIINPPQTCILAVGKGNEVVEPVVGSDGTERPSVVTKMSLTLSADIVFFMAKLEVNKT
ncbi:hypothetical protein RHMOL_Rhmol12G0099800 [Rhododendron molle]|uniref:Uncharacterized protein n=1 Tax=Rhododendron molle TaxID=49168 RepID=A0ACC0LG87_RHOML|nr:hypothetical protein RHMOL_Rhmol12G0099800 [Rhododendron molle]